MKKIILTALISLGALGLTVTTANAKCGDGDKKIEMPSKAQAGKCASGKCAGGKIKAKVAADKNETAKAVEKPKKAAGKCGVGKCGGGK